MAAIIFDFDGTLSDSFDYVAGFMAERAGLPPLSDNRKEKLRGRSMLAMARRLGYPRRRLPGLFWRGRRQMSRAIGHVRPFDGLPEIVKKLHAEGHELFIVSSNTVDNIHKFLHRHKMHTYFLEIYGGAVFSKGRALKRLLKEQRLEREDAVYVADEPRDVRAARSVKMRVIAVTWGFARAADLEALKPTALARDPADLLRILEET